MSRRYCDQCAKAEAACLCAWIEQQDNQLAVLVLQHPDEINKAIGTARLVELGLKRARVVSGLGIVEADAMAVLAGLSAFKPLLLYPKALSESLPHFVLDFETEHFSVSPLLNAYDSLILLDGTWRNTRELLHVNGWLKTLPTLAIKHSESSRYRIRQAKQAGALATIEAVAKVLSVLDETHQAEQLLLPFEKMIEFQIARMGPLVYRQHYLDQQD